MLSLSCLPASSPVRLHKARSALVLMRACSVSKQASAVALQPLAAEAAAVPIPRTGPTFLCCRQPQQQLHRREQVLHPQPRRLLPPPLSAPTRTPALIASSSSCSPVSSQKGFLSKPFSKKMSGEARSAAAAAAGAASAETAAPAVEREGKTERQLLTLVDYVGPPWAKGLSPVPEQQFCLGHLPTPIHRWNVSGLPNGTKLYIKRDDLSGMELSGNKVRKLEFLLAEAVRSDADCVVTIGGIQSNHCRATAVAARYAGLDTFLVLRTSKTQVESDPGLVGNLLVERLVGAHVDLVTKEEYARHGSPALGEKLRARLESEGRRPYVIPVGGSNALGTWGYLNAVWEIEQQLQAGNAGGAQGFDHIVMACGSGGTTAGLALGNHLSSVQAKVHAYGVCDSPDYFYDYVQGILDGMNANVRSRDIVTLKDAKGQGYAISTEEELQTVQQVAQATGIVLDPVYSGKALRGLLQDMALQPEAWEGQSVLFVHTGGLLGMYDKLPQLQPLVGGWRRMDL